MRTFAIETSCDDTSFAIVVKNEKGFFCEKILTYTQLIHNQYGGVMPEFASRAHADIIVQWFDKFLREMGWSYHDFSTKIDCVSVTAICGLPGSLVVGKTFAYFLSAWFQKPLVEVNHVYGHVLSVLLDRDLSDVSFPMTIVSVSGGHSDIYNVRYDDNKEYGNGEWIGSYNIEKIGTTRDDAAGEAFDKVARMLGGPYPGGRRIGEQASLGRQHSVQKKVSSGSDEKSPYYCKRILLGKDDLDFSFSGMKSQVSNFMIHKVSQEEKTENGDIAPDTIQEIAYEFEESMTDIITQKLFRASQKTQAQSVGLVGGVSANLRLREKVSQMAQDNDLEFHLPKEFIYCMDNGAMIGLVGLLMYENSQQ